MNLENNEVYFTTFSINNWTTVFFDFPYCNFILLDNLYYLTQNLDVDIYAFVIMRDHFHVVWKMDQKMPMKKLFISFKRRTGYKIMKYLEEMRTDYLEYFKSFRSDREHKIWNQNNGNLRMLGSDMLKQKIEYIHLNPTKGKYKTVDLAEDYIFSSAMSYNLENKNYRFLTILEGI